MSSRAFRPHGATFSAPALWREARRLAARAHADPILHRFGGARGSIGELEAAARALEAVHAACERARAEAMSLARRKETLARKAQQYIGDCHRMARAFGRAKALPRRPPRNARNPHLIATHLDVLAPSLRGFDAPRLDEECRRHARDLRAAAQAHTAARFARVPRLVASMRKAKLRLFIAMRRVSALGKRADTYTGRGRTYTLNGLRR